MKQKGYKGSNMVDYIFAIENAAEWHAENWKRNGLRHYSLLGLLGGESLQNIQETGAGVYFNVPYADNGRKAKYAVISKSRLCSELHEWKNLYISGRLQKPVQTLVHNEDVESANLQNLRNALSTALLLLPSKFDQNQLYTTISAISYTGDPRMGAGEHPDKPKQIAEGQIERFQCLYQSSLDEHAGNLAVIQGSGHPTLLQFEQDVSPIRRAELFTQLPQEILDRAAKRCNLISQAGSMTIEAQNEGLKNVIFSNPNIVKDLLHDSISSIVTPAAKAQMIKGFFSFGFSTSFTYVLHKLSRGVLRR
uniref:Phosphatidate cytidylyltransferase, mitochondrial n=1 Tax=Hanusia phi TaxID=3032 RepID=A0A7S0HFJ2_9CRYP